MMNRILRILLGVNLVLLGLVAVWSRVVHLNWLPGVNGDECWYGIQARQLIAGVPFEPFTPTGNPLNPIHFGPLVLLLNYLPPSVALLRVPTVMAGLALLLLGYWLIARTHDRVTAAAVTILMATNPALIAYARFGWDSSWSPLVSLLVVYAALRGRLLALGAALVVAALVHPTNVFLAPLAFTLWCARWDPARWARWGDALRDAGKRYRLIWLGLVVSGIILVSVLYSRQWHHRPGGHGLGSRFVAANAGHFALRVVDLVSGISTLTYIAGPIPEPIRRGLEVVLAAIGVIVVGLGTARLRRRRDWPGVGLVVGIVLAWSSLYVIGGPNAIEPHYERYGMGLLVPTLWLLAVCAREVLVPRDATPPPGPGGRRLLVVMSVLGWMGLIGAREGYFRVFERTGGDSHVAFRTDQVEPKLQALRLILDDARGRPARVVAEDWWLEQPLRYLGPGPKQLTVLLQDVKEPWAVANPRPGLRRRIRDAVRPALGLSLARYDLSTRVDLLTEAEQGSYLLVFVGQDGEELITSHFDAAALKVWTIQDRGRRDLIRLYRLVDPAPGRRGR